MKNFLLVLMAVVTVMASGCAPKNYSESHLLIPESVRFVPERKISIPEIAVETAKGKRTFGGGTVTIPQKEVSSPPTFVNFAQTNNAWGQDQSAIEFYHPGGVQETVTVKARTSVSYTTKCGQPSQAKDFRPESRAEVTVTENFQPAQSSVVGSGGPGIAKTIANLPLAAAFLGTGLALQPATKISGGQGGQGGQGGSASAASSASASAASSAAK